MELCDPLKSGVWFGFQRKSCRTGSRWQLGHPSQGLARAGL